MNKIEKLELLTKSVPITFPDRKWIDNVIELLIKQRAHHCKSQLDEAISKDEAFYKNHIESQVIIYKNGGHFSIPVYNDMVEFLNSNLSYNRGIVQQALRQHFNNLHNKDRNWDEVINFLSRNRKTEQDLENSLTEIMLVL